MSDAADKPIKPFNLNMHTARLLMREPSERRWSSRSPLRSSLALGRLRRVVRRLTGCRQGFRQGDPTPGGRQKW